MDGGNNNDPDPLNVSPYAIQRRIMERFHLLYRIMARLRPMLGGLQPDQLGDPRRPELILLREMENDEVCIVNAYASACVFALNREQLGVQDRRDLVERFITVINNIDNLLQISQTEIARLEQQS